MSTYETQTTGQSYYVGLDIHKRIIAYCVKLADGTVVKEGTISSHKEAILKWAISMPHPWIVAMEATMFTGYVYDLLTPLATAVKVANPLMLKAIAASKKKNDRIDAGRIADALRANLLPECYMAPPEIRQLRRVLRYRNFLGRRCVQFKNKSSGLLMECGVPYDRDRLHGKRYFNDLLCGLKDIPRSVKEMLQFNRTMVDTFTTMQKRLELALCQQPLLQQRIKLLQTIPGVGQVIALTWALEIGDPHRFSIPRVISYCGLCSALRQSSGKIKRGPISKQRNKHLQWVLIEAAKQAPRWCGYLEQLRDKERQRGHNNRATLVVARKLATWLLAVDKSQKPFQPRTIA
jgi:transposase